MSWTEVAYENICKQRHKTLFPCSNGHFIGFPFTDRRHCLAAVSEGFLLAVVAFFVDNNRNMGSLLLVFLSAKQDHGECGIANQRLP